MRPELENMTTSDWMVAKSSMNSSSFKQLVRVARTGGITIPSVVVPNYNPRITFVSVSDTAMYQRVKDTDALNEFNSSVKRWAEKVENELKQAAQALFGHRGSDQISAAFPRLSDSIKTNIRFDKQYKLETRSVGFQLARHGVYLHEGAGRGYAGATGSKWTDQYGKTKTTNPNSLGKMGTGLRPAAYWFNDVINRNLDEIADITANYSLDIIVNVDSIFLPE